jgi:hypothetical protein
LQARDADLQARDADLQPRDADLQARDADLQPRDADLQARDTDLQPRDARLASELGERRHPFEAPETRRPSPRHREEGLEESRIRSAYLARRSRFSA